MIYFFYGGCVSCKGKASADLVIRGVKVVAVDDQFSIQEAVIVRGDQIVFVGSDKEVEAFIGSETQVLGLWKDADPGLPEVDDERKRLAGLRE